jgi:protein-S-isoprenylcysteine O-methyltransferase Ste14
MSTTQLLIFGAGTIFIILFSWFLSLREGRYHGIPRFFAFEGLLALLLLNVPVWFRDPLSAPQVVSWLLFIISIYYAFTAFYLFRRFGKYSGNFENTTQLVTTGLYNYIRHPMYGSLAIFGWGMFLKSITWQGFIIILIISISLYITAKVEEKEMLKKFGEQYEMYRTKTKLFIPFIY